MSIPPKTIELANRMKQAFKHVQCFVFEREELEDVRNALREIGIQGLVRLRHADPRYPLIYIVEANLRDCELDCQSKAIKAIVEGRVREELKKQFQVEFIRQCLNFCEHERVKEIISRIEKFLKEMKSESG